MKDNLEAPECLPAHWTKAALGDVAIIINGGTPDSKVAEFWDGGVQWLTPKDMGRMDGREIAATSRTISEAGLARSSARLVPSGSVILSTRAPIGHLAINTAAMAFNQGCRGIIPGKRLDHVFLYHFLAANRQKLDDLGSGTTFKELSGTNLKGFEIPLPPLEEQKRIVAVLDQAFAALDSARANTEANLADAIALFDAWLTAVFHDHPSSWTTRKLRDLCRQVTVGHVGPMATRYVEAGTPFLRSQNIRPFEVNLEDVKFIDDRFRDELFKSQLKPGDVAIVRTGYPGTAAVIPETLPLSNCADLVIARPKSAISAHFLAMFFNSTFGKSMVAAKAVGAAQKHFNVGAAKQVDFSFPSIEEQERIAELSEAIRVQTHQIASSFVDKCSHIADLRQSLLNMAFSGQLT